MGEEITTDLKVTEVNRCLVWNGDKDNMTWYCIVIFSVMYLVKYTSLLIATVILYLSAATDCVTRPDLLGVMDSR